MSKVVSSRLCLQRFYLQTAILLVRVCKGNIFFKEDRYLHTLYLFEIKFTKSMAAKPFWAFGRNEGTNKQIRKHQSFKEY